MYTVWDLTHSLRASGLAATLLILDIGMLVLNRYILLGNTHTHKPAEICKDLLFFVRDPKQKGWSHVSSVN